MTDSRTTRDHLPGRGREKLPEQVRALGRVSFWNDVASDMIVPLLPAFVTGALGLAPAVLGLIEGVAEATASLLKLASGWWSDRVKKRKAFALFGYGLSNVVRPLIGLATGGGAVLGLRFADRIGKGLRTSPRDALLAASVDPSIRGRAFGYHRMMDNLGATLGPALAALILWLVPDGLRLVFLLSAIPGAVAMFVLWTRVREPSAPPAVSAEPKKTLAGGLPKGAFRSYLLVVALFTLGNSSDVFLALRAEQAGVPVAAIPLLWAGLNLVKALSNQPGGALSDRIGRRATMGLGFAVYAACYAGLALAQSTAAVIAWFLVYGLYHGLVEGPERALVADLVPESERGRAYGWFHMVVGVAVFPASALFGLVWTFAGHAAAFGMGAALAALAAVGLALFVRRA